MKAVAAKQGLPHGIDSPAIPSGYKQTELGVIPEHWHIRQLADICMPRGIVRGPFGGTLKKDTFVTSGFKVYEQQNAIYKSAEIGSYFVDQSKYAEMHRFSVSPGDFIISCSGTIGRIFQIPLDAPQGVINQALLKLTTDDEVVYDQYFYILFEWDDFQIRIIDSTQGGAMKNLVGMDVFRTITVVLPPFSEQRAIAEALSDVDGLLNALEALIAKKRAIKQAVMQQLLTGKTRLPGFSEAWEKAKMGNVGSIYGGLSGKSKVDFGGGNARYVTFLGVLENVILDIRHTESVHVGSGESQNRVIKGDLLFNASSETPGDLAIGAVMGEQLDSLYLNSFCFGFRIHDENKHVPLFLAYFSRGSVGRAVMNALAQGATRYNMSKSQFLALELSIPPCDEQHAIASVLSDMDAEIAALEQRRDKTHTIKQGMMQQLLAGRVRLSESRIGVDLSDDAD